MRLTCTPMNQGSNIKGNSAYKLPVAILQHTCMPLLCRWETLIQFELQAWPIMCATANKLAGYSIHTRTQLFWVEQVICNPPLPLPQPRGRPSNTPLLLSRLQRVTRHISAFECAACYSANATQGHSHILLVIMLSCNPRLLLGTETPITVPTQANTAHFGRVS